MKEKKSLMEVETLENKGNSGLNEMGDHLVCGLWEI